VSHEILSPPRAALSRDLVAELSHSRAEPDWLRDLRLRAFEAFERLALPDQRTEGWRRTSLRGLDLANVDLASTMPSVTVRGDSAGYALPLAEALRDPRLAPKIERHFAQIVALDADKFVALHYALFNAGLVLVIPRGRVVDQPIWIDYRSDGPTLAHSLIILEDEADLAAVVEDYSASASLASGVVETVVGANAHMRYVQVQRFASDVWNFSTQRAHLAQAASLRTLNVALGSRMSRNTVQVILEGRGSQADLLGVVHIAAQQHVDFQTLQDHFGNATRSDLVIHDALRGRSSANFTGLIRINKPAHQTESSQQQKNILLSDSSRAQSDPKLEILNNDVIRCTHGAAVGPVDEEMVFYLQSRGLDRASAEGLIVEGFFQSTLARLEHPAVAEAVWSTISEGFSAQ
jgi:Fe-S cluster assembly protein SufD